MLIKHLISICAILSLLVHIQSKYSVGYSISSTNGKVSSPKVSLSKCLFKGGISNSTVIELANCNGIIHLIGLTLGTGTQQTFFFQVDTGSSTLWVNMGNPPTGYNSSLSKTYVTTTQQNKISYGDGSYAAGFMGSDIVNISGTPIDVNSLIMWGTDVADGAFSAGIADQQGILGLDLASYPNFLDLAYQKGQISTPVFALELTGPNQTAYMHYNNGLSPSILSNMMYVPLKQPLQQHWTSNLTSITANKFDLTSLAPKTIMFDSGTAFVLLPTNFYNAIVQKYFSTPECYNDSTFENLRTCYCNNTWPDFVFNFSSSLSATLSAELYKLPKANNTAFCHVGLSSMQVEQVILGAIFMKGYIIQFDKSKKAVGLYDKAANQVYYYFAFYPKWFAVTQYVLCGLGALLTVVGVGFLIHSSKQVK